MRTYVRKFKQIVKQVKGFFPESLPTGVTAFETFAQDLSETYTLPTEDKDSIRFALASIIMHLGPQQAFKSKYYFYLTIKAGAAKQVAGQAFQEIKVRQRQLEEEARKAAEAAAKPAAIADESQK